MVLGRVHTSARYALYLVPSQLVYVSVEKHQPQTPQGITVVLLKRSVFLQQSVNICIERLNPFL